MYLNVSLGLSCNSFQFKSMFFGLSQSQQSQSSSSATTAPPKHSTANQTHPVILASDTDSDDGWEKNHFFVATIVNSQEATTQTFITSLPIQVVNMTKAVLKFVMLHVNVLCGMCSVVTTIFMAWNIRMCLKWPHSNCFSWHCEMLNIGIVTLYSSVINYATSRSKECNNFNNTTYSYH